jgi:membrane fusion protein (multidrug efflux system)
MSRTAFARTFRQLLADRGGVSRTVLAIALLVLGGWTLWAVRSQVTLYEVSSDARVELESATYPVESPLLGRVVQANLYVGQAVHRGDVLVEIDAAPQRLEMQEQNVRAQGLQAQIDQMQSEIVAEEKARAEERKSARLSLEEASHRVHEAEAAARFADAELLRNQNLAANGLIPPRELEKAEAEARQKRSTLEITESAARRLPQEQATRDRERDVRIQRLRSQIAALQEQFNTVHAGIRSLEYEVERRQIRALIDGHVGEAVTLRPGAVVDEAQNLGSIVPASRLRVVAQFPAEAALGRIREGQPGTLRLNAYPWAEFGAVATTVARVAQEIRGGKVRVELNIQPSTSFRGRLEHGMPGSIEIAVEHVNPLALVLRTAGQWLTRRS